MRAAGIVSFVAAVLVLFYAWFATGWNDGTARVTGDRIMLGTAALLIAGSWAMILGRRWGQWLVSALWLLVLALALLA